MHTEFLWGKLRKKYHFEDPGVHGRIDGLIWLRRGTGGG
jgi:hypothetical protein